MKKLYTNDIKTGGNGMRAWGNQQKATEMLRS